MIIENSTADSRPRPAAEPWRPAGGIWDEGDGNPSLWKQKTPRSTRGSQTHGPVAQLVARRFGRAEVAGSSPAWSTHLPS